MLKKEVRVADIISKHANGIADLVAQACCFESDIRLLCDNKNINAKSIMGMMTLGLAAGENVTVSADGDDESEAIQSIEEYLSSEKSAV